MITRASIDCPGTLAAWAEHLEAVCPDGAPAHCEVRGLSEDSRRVSAGDLFFARSGSEANGEAFAHDAAERGAVAVVSSRPLSVRVPVLLVPDVDRALERAADLWYGRPQDALDLVAVTGTKGKTTTSQLIAAALGYCGRKTAVIGTIAYDLGNGRPRPASNTTPGRLELRRLLAVARDAGCRAAVLEVSSHALHQARTHGLEFQVAVFTNLGRDHLDYHGTLDAYFEAKSLLFRGLAPTATAILNREDVHWPQLAAHCRGRVLTFGESAEADLRAGKISLSAERTRFRLTVGGHDQIDVTTPLVGRHNVLNLLAAVGAAYALDVDVVHAAEGAARLSGVRGRLERVLPARDLHVFVDYAHTEEALRHVLSFLGELEARPLTCVVGCGGDRDRTKRPRMARAAAEMADRVVFTSDNPRTEDPEAILREMTAGLDADLEARTVTLADRRAAIRDAIVKAPPGSCVVVAGKGHEDYQILGTKKIHFDDVEEVRAALRLREEGADSAWGTPRG